MAKRKTAKQLDREIDEALGRGYVRSASQDQRSWWIWQLPPVKMLKKVSLPLSYSWKGIMEGEPYSREQVSDALGLKNEGKLRVLPRRFGSMTVIEISGQRRRRQLLTPPIFKFADLKKIDPAVDLKEIGSALFWIQPEILQATRGEIYQGDNVNELLDVDRDELAAASAQEAANAVLVALDAYLASGRPDPRFV